MVINKKNWKKVCFGDLVYEKKLSVDAESCGLGRYVAGDHMTTEDLHLRKWGLVGDGYLGPAFHRKFESGDILYGSRRTYLKKVAVADFDGITSNTTFVITEDTGKVVAGLLPFLMLSDRFTEHSVKNSKGSVNPYINFKDIAKFEFLLPPKDQQARLAELLWAADEVVQKYDDLKKSQILTLNSFFDIVYKEKSLKYLSLGQCLEFSQYGISEQLSDVGDIPVLRMNNLQNKKVVMYDLKYILRSTIKNPESLLLKKGDILFNRTNSYELVGKVGLFDLEKEVTFASYLIRLRANVEIVLPEYLNSYLNSEKGQAAIRVHRTPGVSQSNINVENLKKITIPIVSKNVQLELIKKLALLESAMQETEAAIKSVLTIQKQLINKIFSA